MPELSAGLLLWRRREGQLELLLAHPGGPFFARKDEGAWTIPKGLVEPGEDPLVAARREFEEETGQSPGDGPYLPLGEIRQKGGKLVQAWAVEGDFDPTSLRSNTFEMVWPPRSGRLQSFPEIDRVAFFEPASARRKVNPAQVELIERALEQIERHEG